MSFLSLSFAIFFLIHVILYHLVACFTEKLGKNTVLIQNIILLISNFIFYAFADLRFPPFLLYIIVITYISGRNYKTEKLFIIFLIASLVPLLAIKYCPVILHRQWIFPLGISFFTFQSISYTADTYTKKINPENSFLNIALFISFFPVISSGPIQRAGNLIPQFQKVRHFDYDNATDGMKLFAWGMVKKLCIADRIAVYVNYVYGSVSDQYGFALLLATVLYSFQIYCDFSGYSDMAIGVARYLGLDAGKNFDHPYLSKSVGEFWRRWHISLSSWLRDYIYIPLGGSRGASFRVYLNLMITFLVSGIWHGSTWNFLIWGMLHGFYQCIGRLSKPFLEKIKIPVFIRIVITFCLVTFAWIFFRASTVQESCVVISKIVLVPQDIGRFFVMKDELGIKESIRVLFALNDYGFGGFAGMIKVFFFLALFIVCELCTQKTNGITIIKSKSFLIRWFLYAFLVYILLFSLYLSSNTEFLYFTF